MEGDTQIHALPFPPGQARITHVIHFSDTHIRSGDVQKSRSQEYAQVFDAFCERVAQLPCVRAGTAVLVCTGDVFHHKLRIESAGIRAFLRFMRQLSQLAPVLVIRGNHDYRQDVPDEPDMIGALLNESDGLERVHYLNATGLYRMGNLGLGLVAVQDALASGSTSGRAPSLPPFPDPAVLRAHPDVTHALALYHGMVQHKSLGAMGSTQGSGVPLTWFPSAYDAILLGDVHTQQVHRVFKADAESESEGDDGHVYLWRVPPAAPGDPETLAQPWGYPGSLIQQSFGETLYGHGFLLWDLERSRVQVTHVPNPTGFVCLGQDGQGMEKAWCVRNLGTPPMRLEQALTLSWFPKQIHLRVETRNAEEEDAVPSLLSFLGDRVLSYAITFVSASPATASGSDPHPQQERADAGESPAASWTTTTHDPRAWRAYVEDEEASASEEDRALWAPWFAGDLRAMQVPWGEHLAENDAPLSHVRQKWLERTLRLEKRFGETEKHLEDAAKKRRASTAGTLKLLRMEWQYLYCFMDNCFCDFAGMDQKISCINAKNGRGKTSFLEIVCLALFGEGFPSRATHHGHVIGKHAALICDRKPADKEARVSLEFALGAARHYRITRVLKPEASKSKALLEDLGAAGGGGERPMQVHQGRSAVDAWMAEAVGTLDDFLLACMMTQASDRDFFSLKPAEQRERIDAALSLSAPAAFAELCKEARLSHAFVADLVEAVAEAPRSVADSQLDEAAADVQLRDLGDEKARLAKEDDDLSAHLDQLQRVIVQADARLLEEDYDALQSALLDAEQQQQRLEEMRTRTRTPDSGDAQNGDWSARMEQLGALRSQLGEAMQQGLLNWTSEEEAEAECRALEAEQAQAQEPEPEQPEADLAKMRQRLFQLQGKIPEGLDPEHVNLPGLEQDLAELKAKLEEAESERAQLDARVADDETRLADTRHAYEALLLHPQPLPTGRQQSALLATQVARDQELQRLEATYGHLDGLDAALAANARALTEAGAGSACSSVEAETEALEQQIRGWKALLPMAEPSAAHPSDVPPNPAAVLLAAARAGVAMAQGLRDIETLARARDHEDLPPAQKTALTKRLLQQLQNLLAQPQRHAIPEDASRVLEVVQHHPEVLTNSVVLELHERIANAEARVTKLRELEAARVHWVQEKAAWHAHLENRRALEEALQQSDKHRVWKETMTRHQRDIRALEAACQDGRKRLGVLHACLATDAQRYAKQEAHVHALKHVVKELTDLRSRLDIAEARQARRVRGQHARLWVEMRQLEADLEHRQCNEKVTALRAAVQAWDAHQTREVVQARRAEVRTRLQDVQVLCKVLQQKLETLAKARTRDCVLKAWLKALRHRARALEHVHVRMEGFKAWAYERRIIPMLKKRVNGLMAMMCGQTLWLDVAWKEAQFFWLLRNGEHAPPIEKASGFQRFMASLAMRIALGQLGIMRCKQLFIDEGFTACDADNLGQVPGFLRHLLGCYDHVMLVSHLDEIKDNVDVGIRIAEHRIQHGSSTDHST